MTEQTNPVVLLGRPQASYDELRTMNLEEQKGERTPESTSDAFQRLLRATSFEDIKTLGYGKVGNLAVTPKLLERARTDEKTRVKLFQQFKTVFKPTEVVDDSQLTVPFSTPDFKDVTPLPSEVKALPSLMQESIVRDIKGEQKVASMLTDSTIPKIGQELIQEKFQGAMFDNAGVEMFRMIQSLPSDFTQTFPTLGIHAYNAGKSLFQTSADWLSYSGPEGQFGFKENLKDNFAFNTQQYQPVFDNVREFSNFPVIRTEIQALDADYKRRFIDKYSEDLWSLYHQRPSFEISTEGGVVSSKPVLDENGNQVMEDYIPEVTKAHEQILMESFSGLKDLEKSMVFFGPQSAITKTGLVLNVSKGTKWANQVAQARKNNPDRYEGIPDYKVLRAIQKENYGPLNPIRRFFNGVFMGPKASSGIFNRKTGGTLLRGQIVNSHVEKLAVYDTRIATLEKQLDDVSLLNPTVINARKKADLETELEFIKESQREYVRVAGNGKYNNPYTKQAFADDIYMSLAFGHAELISSYTFDKIFQDEDVGYTITALAAPLFAPALGQKGYDLSKFVLSNSIFLKEGTTAVQSMASMLENSDVFRFITPGMLVRNDSREIQQAAEAAGVELNENSLNAIDKFHRFLVSAETNADVGGGQIINMRQRMFDGLKKYGDIMSRNKKRLTDMKDPRGNALYTDSEINDMMRAMHLSVAHASGIAPLIAIQQSASAVKPSMIKKLMGAKEGDVLTLNTVFKSMAQEEETIKGMTTNLRILQDSLASKNVLLDSNDPIQTQVNLIQTLIDKQENQLVQKKIAVNKGVQTILDNPEGLTAQDMRLLAKITAEQPKGEGNIGRLIENIKSESAALEKNARVILRAIARENTKFQKFSADMSEAEYSAHLKEQARLILTTAQTVRYNKGREAYASVDEYVENNNIEIPMIKVLDKLLELDDELKGQDAKNFLAGGARFLNTTGRPLKAVFNSMSRRNIIRMFANQGEANPEAMANQLLETARNNEQIPEAGGFLDLAVFLTNERGNEFKLFNMNMIEAETTRRFFQERVLFSNTEREVGKTNKQLSMQMRDAIEQVYDEADPTGRLRPELDLARKRYTSAVGDMTEKGTYSSGVDSATQRTETIVDSEFSIEFDDQGQAKPIPEGVVQQGDAILFGSRTPEAPYIAMGSAIRTITNPKSSPAAIANAQQTLINNKNFVMQTLGATKVQDGNKTVFAFDLSDADQRANFEAFGELLRTVTHKYSEDNLFESIGAVKGVDYRTSGTKFELPEGISPEDKTRAAELKDLTTRLGIQSGRSAMDFDRGKEIMEIENTLQIPVIEKPGAVVEFRKAHTEEFTGAFASVDELLKKKVTPWVNGYETIRNRMNNRKDELNILAKAEFDKDEQFIAQLEKLGEQAGDPLNFFNRHFETGNTGSIQDLKEDLVKAGMSSEDADVGMKNLFARGLLARAGVRYIKEVGMNDPQMELGDIKELSSFVASDAKKQLIIDVLGDEHYEHIEDIVDWALLAIGDGAGLRAVADTKGMSIDSMISRLFNVSRGLVSPEYVLTELGFRVLLKRNQDLMGLMLSDKNAAFVLAKIINTPRAVSREDLQLLSRRIHTYILAGPEGIFRTEGELPALDLFLNTVAGLESDTGTLTEQKLSEIEKQNKLLEEAAKNQEN